MASGTVVACQTWTDLARSVAWDFGLDISEDFAGYVLWNETGFPGFWTGDPRECCTQQLRTYFAQSGRGGDDA